MYINAIQGRLPYGLREPENLQHVLVDFCENLTSEWSGQYHSLALPSVLTSCIDQIAHCATEKWYELETIIYNIAIKFVVKFFECLKYLCPDIDNYKYRYMAFEFLMHPQHILISTYQLLSRDRSRR